MAYSREEIFDKAVKIVTEHQPLFVDDLVSYLPCARSTFYLYFPDGSDELDKLKELIEKNKIAQKSELRKNWKDSEAAPALQLALYKLLANQNEHKALQMAYQDHTTQGEKINVISLGSGIKPDESNS